MFCKNCGHGAGGCKFCMNGTLLKSESSSAETDETDCIECRGQSNRPCSGAVANRERLLWVMVVILVVVVGILAIALGTAKIGK